MRKIEAVSGTGSRLYRLASPLLIKEVRRTFRSRGFFAIHIVLLTIVAVGALLVMIGFGLGTRGRENPAWIGKLLFGILSTAQFLVVLFVLPAYSAVSIVEEKDKLTFDLLITTKLAPWEIVWGKLLGSLTTVGVILISFLPLLGLSFLFGGVTVGQILSCYISLILLAALISAFSLYISSASKSAKRATSLVYAIIILFCLPLPSLLIGLFLALSRGSPRGIPNLFSFMAMGLPLRQAMFIVACYTYFYLSVLILSFLSASNRLKPALANKSTNVRIFFLAYTALGTLLYFLALYLYRSGITLNEQAFLQTSFILVIFVPLFLGTLFFCGEFAVAPPRIRSKAERFRGIFRPLRLLLPGSPSGLTMAILWSAIILVGGFGLWLLLFGTSLLERVDMDVELRNGEVILALSLIAWVTLFMVGALAFFFSSLGLSTRSARGLTFLALVLLAGLPLINISYQSIYREEWRTTWLNFHYLSPALVWASVMEDYGEDKLRLALGGELYHLHMIYLPIYLVGGMALYLVGRRRRLRLLAAREER